MSGLTTAVPLPALKNQRPLSLTADCLQPIADGLRRLTAHCWNICFRREVETPEEKALRPYLQVDGFRRSPHFSIDWL